MKIAIVGASGFVGRAILEEALARGHDVSALVRDIGKLAPSPRLRPIAIDITDVGRTREVLAKHHVIVSAVSGHAHSDILQAYLAGIRGIIDAAKFARVSRLLVVGGAGSLEVKPGVQLLDTPSFPQQWRATAEGARQALAILQSEQDLEWTMLSPSAHLEPGPKTGKYRTALDDLLVDEHGESHISLGDYADAMLNEIERPRHSRRRFTVGY